jgi:AraC-like DNA-binding protein
LVQTKSLIDSRFEALDKLYIKIGFDEEIKLIMSKTTPFEPVDLLEIVKLKQSLNLEKLSNTDLSYVYIYFKRTNFVLTTEGVYDMDLFLRSASVFQYDSQLFLDMIEGNANGLVAFKDKSLGSDQMGIAYIRGLPYARTQNSLGKLIFILNESALRKTMSEMKWIPEAQIYILDGENRIIAGDEIYKDEMISPGQIMTLEQIESLEQNKVISRVKSDYCDWTYMSIIPSDVFYERAELIKNIFIIALLVFIAIGTFVSYKFAQSHYNPMDELVKHIQSAAEQTTKTAQEGDEYHVITNIVDNIIKEKEQYAEKETRQKEKLVNDFYINLIKGKMSGKDIDEMKKLYKLELEMDSLYQVSLLSVDEAGMSVINSEADKDTGDYADMIQLVFSNVLTELIKKKYKHTLFRYDDDIVCIVKAAKGQGKSIKTDLNKIMIKAENVVKNRFNIGFIFVAGDFHAGYGGISRSYQEAAEAMEYCIITGCNNLFFHDMLAKTRKIDDYSYKQDVQQFTQQLMIGDIYSARKIMSEIFSNRLLSGEQPISFIKLRMNMLIHSFLVATCEFWLSSEDPNRYINAGNELLSARTIAELQIIMGKMVDEYQEHIQHKVNSEQAIYQKTLSYIHENYSSNSLSISAIADEFDVSVQYLSKRFKKKMGIGPLEYLQLLRIEKSKQLLNDGNNRIKDVAKKIGFINSASFIRVFKKYEGVSPGVYRASKVV